MKPKCVTLFFLLILFIFSATSSGQEMIIPDVEIPEGATTVEVPVYIVPPASTRGYQLSIVWSSEIMTFDSLIFSEDYAQDNLRVQYNLLTPEEIRVLVRGEFGSLDPLKPSKDSIGFVLHFSLLEVTGRIELRFNPDFPNSFGGYEFTTATTNGSVFTTTTSTQRVRTDLSLRVFPNPFTTDFRVRGLPASSEAYPYSLLDQCPRPHGIDLAGRRPAALRAAYPGTGHGTTFPPQLDHRPPHHHR